VSEATWAIAQRSAVGETYHISSEHIIAIKDLVAMICTALHVGFDDHVRIVDERLGKDSAYWLNSAKIRKDLAWRDTISLEEGLAQTLGWARENLPILDQQPMQYTHKP
jgi:dTDP-glucose 4,6-dehydratase